LIRWRGLRAGGQFRRVARGKGKHGKNLRTPSPCCTGTASFEVDSRRSFREMKKKKPAVAAVTDLGPAAPIRWPRRP